MTISFIKRTFLLIAILTCLRIYAETSNTEEPINPEDIPVLLPVVNVPVVELPTVDIGGTDSVITGEVTLELKTLSAYPYAFYTAPITVKVDEYPNAFRDAVTGGLLISFNNDQYRFTVNESAVQLIDVNRAVVIPEITIQQVDEVNINIVDAKTGEVVLANVPLVDIAAAKVVLPEIADPNYKVAVTIRLISDLMRRVHDQRSVLNDWTINSENLAIGKWVQIYTDYETNGPYPVTYQPMHSGLKMIAEARIPKTELEAATQLDNLDWYASKGYNACLLSVYMDENLSDLLNWGNTIIGKGYDLYIAYSGTERLEDSVFKDPDIIRTYLSTLAINAKGFLLGWRRTSVHLFIQDPAFSDYLIRCVRSANPMIELIGEGYYGQTADTNYQINGLTYNMPEHMSSCALFGVGYSNVNANNALNNLFNAISPNQRIPVVLGDNAYYKSRHKNGRSFQQNFEIKQFIENKFLKAGAYGIITFHGDGSGEATDCLTSPRD